MTLRTRLTAAFLAVVLGPVLLGAVFVGYTVGAVSQEQAAHRLDVAAGAAHSAMAALCQQLRIEAALAAAQPAERQPAVAETLVAEGRVSAVRVEGPDGSPVVVVGRVPARSWADCDAPAEPSRGRFRAVAASATIAPPTPADDAPAGGTDPAEEEAGAADGDAPDGDAPDGDDADRDDADEAGGVSDADPVTGPSLAPDPANGQETAGVVWAVARLDQSLVDRLTAASGVAVTIPDAGLTGVLSTDTAVESSLTAADGLPAGQVTESSDGRWVRRLEPSPGQPLPLVLATPRSDPFDFQPLLSAVVGVAGLLAVLAAWRLGRATTRPLAELAAATDRVAEGDLTTRVPIRTADETGQLAATFNRMTHRMQLYVQALTTSRDQLRRHLTVLGETLSGTHDLDRILRVILQTALATTGASGGAVLLVDERTRELVGHAAEHSGQPDEAGLRTSPLRVPLGQGLLGRVADTGEARRGRLSADGPALHEGEPRCRTYVVVPITAPGRVVGPAAPWPVPAGVRGVLALYDRLGGEQFDHTDLVTLQTFASQAGVAVDNVRIHQEAQRLSLTDPLTGLWNYRYLSESIRREVERAVRFRHPLAVLVLDLDRFKDVNDAYGHPAGDAVLVEFAHRVRSAIREVDLAFRHGGEEFTVMLPETDARGATVLAQRLGAAVRDQPIVIARRGGDGADVGPVSDGAGRSDDRGDGVGGGGDRGDGVGGGGDRGDGAGDGGGTLAIRVTVSIGVAVYPEHARAPAALLEAADGALYAAKAAGRDTFRVATATASTDGPDLAGPADAAGPDVARPDAAGPADAGSPEAPESGGPVAESGGPGAGGAQPPRQSRGR